MKIRTLLYLLLFWGVTVGTFAKIQMVEHAHDRNSAKTVKIGWYQSDLFQEGMSDDVPKTGYCYEYIHKIADINSWKYQYVYGNWPELFAMLESGKIDILAGVSKTPDRIGKILYPNEFMGKEHYVLYQHADRRTMDINDLRTIAGKKIGTIKDNLMTISLEKWNKEKQADAIIVYYNSFEERDLDFASCKLDALVTTDNGVLNSSGYAQVARVGMDDYYLAVTKGRQDLLDELNYAQDYIQDVNPYYLNNLAYKCYGTTLANSSLTAIEEAWVKAHKEIVIGYLENYIPYSGTNDDGQAYGLITDVMDAILHKLNLSGRLSVKYRAFSDGKAMIEAVKHGKIDAAFPIGGEIWQLEQRGIKATNDVVTSNVNLVYKGTYSYKGISRIAVTHGNTMMRDYLVAEYPDAEITEYESIFDCLDAVLSGKADATTLNGLRVDIIKKSRKYKSLSMMRLDKTSGRCLGVAIGNTGLQMMLNRGLKLIGADFGINASYSYMGDLYQVTVTDFIADNFIWILGIVALVFAIVIYVSVQSHRKNKAYLRLEEEKNQELSEKQVKLEEVTAQQKSQIEEITNLNKVLGYRQVQLEKVTAEQKKQIEEINRLNELFKETQDHGIKDLLDRIIRRDVGSALIDELMQTVGEYYKADRAYIFERDKTGQYTVNTYEWCAEGINPEIDNLQKVPIGVVDPWMEEFKKKGSFFISCDDEYAKKEPIVYEVLEPQGITSLMAAPMIIDGDIIGFAGVDNPKQNLGHELYISVAANIVNHERQIISEREQEQAYKNELEKSRETAEAANKAKTSFLFNMSHDIRTPMNAVIGFTNLLRKNQEDPVKRNDYLNKIEGSSNVLLSIINNVLEMARIEKGSIELVEVPIIADEVISAIIEMFHDVMKTKGITFTYATSIQQKNVYVDSTKLREVFINILSNAYKYTNPGGKVDMRFEEVPSTREGYAFYRTTITDTGIGMSEDFLPRLFDEFSRENNTTENKIEGTGLGMPIVKRLVGLMDGTIEVQSQKGVGTTIVITLPHRIVVDNDATILNKIDVNSAKFEGKRILLAEDNDLNAEIAVEILGEFGFKVERAEDGAVCVEMLEKADDNYYDLVLMDIQMPNMNGYEATRAIRAMVNKSKAAITILAMTANAFEEDKREAVLSGMNGHLAKPIDVAELKKALAMNIIN